MDIVSRLTAALAAGLVLGALVVVGVWMVADDDDGSDEPSQEVLVEELTAVWTRWREGTTAVYEERLERTDADGDVQYVEVVDVYRVGEDALIVSDAAGRINGALDGQGISCGLDPDDRNCYVEGEYVEGQALDAELRDLRESVLDRKTYRLSDIGGGCWRLRRIRDVVSPVWGDQIDLCYDQATGVEVSSVTTTELGVDTVTRSVRSTDVTLADLRDLVA